MDKRCCELLACQRSTFNTYLRIKLSGWNVQIKPRWDGLMTPTSCIACIACMYARTAKCWPPVSELEHADKQECGDGQRNMLQ